MISGDFIEDECKIPNSTNVPLQFGLTFDVDPIIYPECHPHLSITFPNSQGIGIQRDEFLHFLQECCTKLPLGTKNRKNTGYYTTYHIDQESEHSTKSYYR